MSARAARHGAAGRATRGPEKGGGREPRVGRGVGGRGGGRERGRARRRTWAADSRRKVRKEEAGRLVGAEQAERVEREEGVEVDARPPAWRAPPPPRRAHEARLGRAARAEQKKVPRPQAWLLWPLSPLAHSGLVQQRLARRGGKGAQLSLQQRLRWALASSQRHLRQKARRWRPRRDEHSHRCDHQGEPAPERARGAGCAVEVHRERPRRRFWLQLVMEVAEPRHGVK